MRPFTPGAEIRGPDAMLRSFVLCSLATTATATAPRPALLQLRGGGGAKGGAVEEQPKTGKLWAAPYVETKASVDGQVRPKRLIGRGWPQARGSPKHRTPGAERRSLQSACWPKPERARARP